MIIDDASIRVHIKSKPCSRATAVVSSTRTNAVARSASLPENRGKVRRMLTLLYGLCPLAHLAAFEGALSAARGEDEKLAGPRLERHRLLTDAVRLEGLTENLRVLLLEASRLELESEALNVMPGDLPPAPSLEPVDARAVGRLRAVLSQAASALLKLPMSSTWSETEHNLAQRTRAELPASMNAAAAIAQTSLWGMPPEDFCSLVEKPDDEAAAAIMQWAKTYAAKLPAAHLLASMLACAETLDPRAFPESEIPPLPHHAALERQAFSEELCYRMLHDPGFDLAPFWQGTPRLTGSAARLRNHPVVEGLLSRFGCKPAVLMAARIVETAEVLRAYRACTMCREARDEALEAGDAFTHILSASSPADGTGICLVETARGLLAHAAAVSAQGELTALRITSPTEWQFSPNGPGQRIARPVVKELRFPQDDLERRKLEVRVRRALFALDACVPITFAYTPAVGTQAQDAALEAMRRPAAPRTERTDNGVRAPQTAAAYSDAAYELIGVPSNA